MRQVLQVVALALTTLALIATTPPDPQVATCTVGDGTFVVSGTCTWDGSVTISSSGFDRCSVSLSGAVQAAALGVPDAGLFSFEDHYAEQSDAGRRSCTAVPATDGGFTVTCSRCLPAECASDCTATFTP